MNIKERTRMVKAMEYIARNLNDESIFYTWLSVGVADGDIPYGDLEFRGAGDEVDEEVAYYCEDKNFADLMDTFLRCMRLAKCNYSGLYCDGIVSKSSE